MRLPPATLAAVLLAGLAAPASAQIEVRATLSSDTIGLDESVEYQVSVRGAGLRDVDAPRVPTPPGLTRFGQSQTSEVSIVNGSVERRVVFTLVYRPYRVGATTIGPAVMQVGRERYTAPPLPLTVVQPDGAARRGRAAPPGAAFPPPFAGEEPPTERRGGLPPIFVSNRLDRDTVFVGEQAVLTFAFYQSPRAMVLDQPNYSSAKTPGFWTQDFNREPQITRELLDGEPYTIQRFYYGLFPLTAGRKTISPASLTLTLRDPMTFMDRARTRTLTGDTLHLTVLPLPTEGRPADFGGAVGRFRLEARVEPRELERDAPANVVITIAGEGNLATVSPPPLPATDGLKVFDPEVSSRVETGNLTVGGSKAFRYLIVPKRSGTVDLGTVSLSYFDPEARAYRTAAADLGSLAVRRPAGGVDLAEGRPGGSLAGIRTAALDAGPERPWLSPVFWTLAGLPPLALALLALGRRRRDRRARAVVAPPLAAAARLRDDPGPEGVARAERNLIAHLEARHGVALAGLPVSAREAALRSAGAAPETAERAARAMRALEDVAFAPPWARSEALARALGVLETLESAERPRRARLSRRGLPFLALIGATLWLAAMARAGAAQGESRDTFAARAAQADSGTASHARPRAGPEGPVGAQGSDSAAARIAAAAEATDWERANRRYLLDDASGAEALYRRVLAAHPNSVSARYNLGNALFRQGRTGAALQQYLIVLRAAPRDAAARANAETARRSLGANLPPEERSAIAGPAEPPASWLSLPEAAWAGLATLYVLGLVGAAGVAIRRLRPVATAVAAVILLAAIVLASLLAWSRARAPEALVVVPAAQTRAGPSPVETAVVTLPEGAALDVGEARGDWVFVSLPNGLSGWAPRRDIGRIP